jgi:hypothetical protein
MTTQEKIKEIKEASAHEIITLGDEIRKCIEGHGNRRKCLYIVSREERINYHRGRYDAMVDLEKSL